MFALCITSWMGRVKARAGSGHLFSGLGRVWAVIFWPGSGSGWSFLATGQFRPPILVYFDQFFSKVRAGLGQPKSGPCWPWVRPLKIHGPRAKFRVGPRPDPALDSKPCRHQPEPPTCTYSDHKVFYAATPVVSNKKSCELYPRIFMSALTLSSIKLFANCKVFFFFLSKSLVIEERTTTGLTF